MLSEQNRHGFSCNESRIIRKMEKEIGKGLWILRDVRRIICPFTNTGAATTAPF
jgi:hypothetical protein